mgnify:CR=1 FL=1
MITKNEIGALAPLLVTFLMLIFCMLGMEMFSNNIMNVITDILPVGQLMTLNILEVPERFTLKVIYSVITVFLTTLLGYLLFRKADLK